MMIAKGIQSIQNGLQSWQKMLADSYTDPDRLLSDLDIPTESQKLHPAAHRRFPMLVPPSFAHRMTTGDLNDPLLRQVLPVTDEFVFTPGFARDPLAEQDCNHPGLLHKYANRVLLMVTGRCAVNCRYCFRRYFPHPRNGCDLQRWSLALNYPELPS
jgi:KamA family protein